MGWPFGHRWLHPEVGEKGNGSCDVQDLWFQGVFRTRWGKMLASELVSYGILMKILNYKGIYKDNTNYYYTVPNFISWKKYNLPFFQVIN